MVGTDWQHQPAQPTIQSQPPAGNAEQQLMSREDSQLPGDDIPQPPPSINPDPCKGDEDIGAWDILWKAGGGTGALKTMTFMASSETCDFCLERGLTEITEIVACWMKMHEGFCCPVMHRLLENAF